MSKKIAPANKELSTELKILEAARAVFHARGIDGATMQEIADTAGINKAMLHYYFRSKDKLFEVVFHETIMKVIPQVVEVFFQDMPFDEKIRRFVERYIDILQANPAMPAFVLHELNQRPERLVAFIGSASNVPHVASQFFEQIHQAVQEGVIKPITPEQFFVSVLGMCVFPFIAKPILTALMGRSDEEYQLFLQERKVHLAEFILDALRPLPKTKPK